MKNILDKIVNYSTDVGMKIGGKIIFAIVALIVGIIVIKIAKKLIKKAQSKSKLDKTAQNVIKNIVLALLYGVLALIIIEILGIPMTSVIAVIASCGLAIGMALQGALGNFAGGIMILIFRPFKVGDYIEATGVEGIVKEISVFYTHLVTFDNKHITIPNGDLMNNNVTNYSCEENRRVDYEFKVTNDINATYVRDTLLSAATQTANVIKNPEPFVRLVNVDDDTFIFVVRVWCKSTDYWTVYHDLLDNCTAALRDGGIDDPEERIAVRIVKED